MNPEGILGKARRDSKCSLTPIFFIRQHVFYTSSVDVSMPVSLGATMSGKKNAVN